MATGRKFAVFDIDGTLIRWQLYAAVVDSLAKMGYISPKLHADTRTARLAWKNRAHSEAFETYIRTVVDMYTRVLGEITVAQFTEAVDDAFNEYKDQVYIYSRELIKRLKKQGYLLFAISGSHTEIVAKITKYYGFDDYAGTTYFYEGNRFTGEKIEHVGGKHVILESFIKTHNAGLKGSLALGDSKSDISMLEMVEQPIAFNPEKKLFEKAEKSGWKIVIERKNMIYELEKRDGKYQLVKAG